MKGEAKTLEQLKTLVEDWSTRKLIDPYVESLIVCGRDYALVVIVLPKKAEHYLIKGKRILTRKDFDFIPGEKTFKGSCDLKYSFGRFLRWELKKYWWVIILTLLFVGGVCFLGGETLVSSIAGALIAGAAIFTSIFVLFTTNQLQIPSADLLESGTLIEYHLNDKYLSWLGIASVVLSIWGLALHLGADIIGVKIFQCECVIHWVKGLASFSIALAATSLFICLLSLPKYYISRSSHASMGKAMGGIATEWLKSRQVQSPPEDQSK